MNPFAYGSISIIEKDYFSRLLMLKASFTTLSQCYLASMTWLANSSESKDENDVIPKKGLLYYK